MDELHEKFLNGLDINIEKIKIQENLKNSKDNVELCLERYSEITYNKKLPIVWVTEKNPIIKNFYSSEFNLGWMLAFVRYYTEVIPKEDRVVDELENDSDLSNIYRRCLFMSIALSMIEGVNIVDDVIYVLGKDVEFIDYKLDKLPFAISL
jgi:hypothetical protein